MKPIILVALALVAVTIAAPFDEGSPKIIRSEFEPQPEGGYIFSFETENGISRHETGEIKEAADEEGHLHKVLVVRGTYTYKDLEGHSETVNYSADETGYHSDANLPKA